jgi:peptide-methionine (R)-S-oxide reductase
MKRRALLRLFAAAPLAALAGAGHGLPRTMKEVEELQKNWRSLLAPGIAVPDPAQKLELSKDEWRRRLSREAFRVLREEGTEPAFTSPLNDEKRPGVFLCAGCDLPLFSSAMKYDSGTGWPSFFTTIPGVFGTKKDYYLLYPRTEYHCIRCGGHHGHVFDDGPPPTRLRYCNNGVALRFVPLRP